MGLLHALSHFNFMVNFVPQKCYNCRAIRENKGVQQQIKSLFNCVFSKLPLKNSNNKYCLLYQRISGWLLGSSKHNCDRAFTKSFTSKSPIYKKRPIAQRFTQ